ncbi:Histone demethylase UTX [Camponotus japonicus]
MDNIDWLRPPEQELNIEVDAKTIIKACKGKGLNKVPQHSLLNSCQQAPPNQPNQRLLEEHLLPYTPTMLLSDKNEVFNPWIRDFCLGQPIVLLTGLTKIINFNLSLFQTKTIVKADPDGIIEVRMQMPQTNDENWNQAYNQKVWDYYSYRDYSSISEYALYQNKEYLKSIKKERNIENNENSNFDQSNLKENQKMIKKGSKENQKIERRKKKIRFGTNVDLSNVKKWKSQLEELKKLPPLFQVESDDNMLNYVGYKILGMNTIQLYMAVPGCRTPGHQENNNFCSVNINIGPDDCKWFAVPYEYWGALYSLCERHNIDYLNGSWWPNLDELYENNIPVYKFHQKPGDLVWVNVGCVHWIQAIGFCNNIAWNVGPFTAKQYQAAIESDEWNKLRGFRSIVPMVHLSWNLACKVKISDVQLYKMIKNCLFLTLRQYYLTLEFVKNKGAEIEAYNCDTSYCVKCMIELFGILFSLPKNNQNVPYCLDCAFKLSPLLEGFVCVEEKNIHALINIYDNFTLNELSTVNAAFTCSKPNWQNLEDGLDVDADARTIIEACESKELNSVPEFSLLDVCHAPLDPPNQQLQEKQLSPSTPSISLTSEYEAWEFEPWLKAYCWNHPIALIHDLTSIVGFNRKLFWTGNIRKTFRKLKIERRTQMQQSSIENWDKTYSNKVWKCYNRRSYTTLKEHEKYQTTMASEIINEYEDEQIYMTFENCENMLHIKKNKIHLGTNVDICIFEKKWKLQLKELRKLPSFLQVDSENNMLSYIDHKILGVNTLQLYLMVPGSRITGQQQNNNFCTVSINVGSGNCEWFVIPYEYWEVIYSLCERNDVDYVNDSWWPPSLNELHEHNVPVYKFVQEKGDMVWLNIGCVYWMQANSICNNIMWNVGPFMARQYQLALERYEWNKLHSFQSIVPMINLSWNLARKTKISDPQLYRLIKACMLLTLKQCYLLLKFVKNKGVEVESCDNKAIMHYCDKCLIELFSIVLIQEQRKNPVSYCLDCALKCCPLLKGFICLEKHSIKDLMDVYDNFTLDLSMSVSS